MARAMVTAMANGNATETVAAMVDGDRNGNGRWQRQWAMATVDGKEVGNGDRDGDGNCNGNGHSEGNNDEGRVASSCAGDVQSCGRGDTLPLPPWTQRRVYSPALCHWGDTAKSVCSLSRGRVPDSSPLILFLFIIYNYYSVY
jgi:hypothetical protein